MTRTKPARLRPLAAHTCADARVPFSRTLKERTIIMRAISGDTQYLPHMFTPMEKMQDEWLQGDIVAAVAHDKTTHASRPCDSPIYNGRVSERIPFSAT